MEEYRDFLRKERNKEILSNIASIIMICIGIAGMIYGISIS